MILARRAGQKKMDKKERKKARVRKRRTIIKIEKWPEKKW